MADNRQAKWLADRLQGYYGLFCAIDVAREYAKAHHGDPNIAERYLAVREILNQREQRHWELMHGQPPEQDETMSDQADKAYAERNRLVAALTKLLPASLEKATDTTPEEQEQGWNWVVFIDIPIEGQATWHIHDSELPLFRHVCRCRGAEWDGHSTEEKYRRLADMPFGDNLDRAYPDMLRALRFGRHQYVDRPSSDLLDAADILRQNGHEDLAYKLENKYAHETDALLHTRGF